MTRLAVGVAAALVIAGLAAAPAAGDTAVVTDGTAQEVSAFNGALVWSRQVANDDFRLVQRVDGVTRDAPVARAPHAFDADLGPGTKGEVVAVYSRCGPVALPSDCDVFQLDVRSGRERKLSAISKPGCSETSPSTWAGTVAFVREGKRGCKPALYVKRPKAAPALLAKVESDLAGGGLLTDFVATDVRKKTVVAVRSSTDGGSSGTRSLELWKPARSSTKRCVIEAVSTGSLFGINALESPVLDDDRLYWAKTQSRTGAPPQYFNRAAARCKAPVERAQRGPSAVGHLAVDRGAIYYVSEGRGVFEADDPAPAFSVQR